MKKTVCVLLALLALTAALVACTPESPPLPPLTGDPETAEATVSLPAETLPAESAPETAPAETAPVSSPKEYVFIVEPVYDYPDVIPVFEAIFFDGFPYFNVADQDADPAILSYAYYRDAEGRYGLLAADGSVAVPAEKEISWCGACRSFVDRDHVYYDKDLQAVTVRGHGGLSRIFYDTSRGSVAVTEPDGVRYLTAKDISYFTGALPCLDLSREIEGQTPTFLLLVEGKAVTSPTLTCARGYSDGLAAAEENGEWCYYDQNGGTVTHETNLYAGSYRNGVAAVKTADGKAGFILKDGTPLFPFDFEEARTFAPNGEAWVKVGGKWGKIRYSGR
ncbi:MAG: WG repeat-containing protein [Clostridia bacterium]|nr:WG repeat-containing protein [Clostridia bacterium]